MSGFSLGKVGAIVTAKPPSKGKTAEQPMAKVYSLAALDKIMASIGTVRDSIRAEIECVASAYYIKTGCAKKARPGNFRAIERSASAAVELRKRGVKLSDEEADLCEQLGIKYDTVPVTLDAFVINPDALTPQVTKALESVIGGAIKSGKLPEDIIQKQQGSYEKRLPEGALEALFETGNEELCEQALKLCGVMAIGKTKFEDGLSAALSELGTVMDDPEYRKLAEAPEREKTGGKKKAA